MTLQSTPNTMMATLKQLLKRLRLKVLNNVRVNMSQVLAFCLANMELYKLFHFFLFFFF